MYKKIETIFGVYNNGIKRVSDGASIPFAPDNTDYQKFKKDIIEGGELQDADGNTMTAAEAKAFVATLP